MGETALGRLTVSSELKPCPFCGSVPNYKTVNYCQNFDSTGKIYFDKWKFKAEIIECSNLSCPGRFAFVRVGTNDAIELWNTRVE